MADADVSAPSQGDVLALLDAAVAAMGGRPRDGQREMASAVSAAFDGGEHLLVQAGTGTGKSLAYLAAAIHHAVRHEETVVVSTATVALQSQIVRRDLPALIDAVTPLLPRRPTFAILKGRRHYLCRNRLAGDVGADGLDIDLEAAARTKAGREMARLQKWAASTATGDRDDLLPGVSDRAWNSVSVSARECLGATACPSGDVCFAEKARGDAERADIVVTNHALLAISALEGIPVLPEHSAVVIDEAHELVDRVTATAAEEVSTEAVHRAVTRCRRLADAEDLDRLTTAGGALADAVAACPDGRIRPMPPQLADALRLVSSAARTVHSAVQRKKDDTGATRLAEAALESLRSVAERCEAGSDLDVLWRAEAGETRVLRVAPLSVGALLQRGLFEGKSVVLTSATLQVGGSFDVLASGVGLRPPATWRSVDVGSPFDYPRQGILYVAAHLPPPGRDAMAGATLDELAELMEAAGGRTLGLFSSMRAAREATEALRTRIATPILCQGEQMTGELVSCFAADPETSLFGTLSLWQGIDVPGSSLNLVVIDRIPFPRPDDPLTTARVQAAGDGGGNGFLEVSATAAAVRLAQGAGRLIRSAADRGVVAVLDPRLATARYGGYLLSALPPLWRTTDPAQVRRSLAALTCSARQTAAAPVAVPA